MIQVRRSKERGFFDHGWLRTFHSFSFADYFDPQFMGFRSLRVINEDYVAAGQGFGTHGHKDMEIITYMIEGSLQHKDSMGNGSVIGTGEIQYMSAGSGVTHSEFNPDAKVATHLLQIWIRPDQKDYTPAYDQKKFDREKLKNQLGLLVSKDGANGSIKIRQDAQLYSSILDQEKSLTYTFGRNRYGWLQIVNGSFTVNGITLEAGDGAAISNESEIRIEARGPESEFLLFDLN